MMMTYRRAGATWLLSRQRSELSYSTMDQWHAAAVMHATCSIVCVGIDGPAICRVSWTQSHGVCVFAAVRSLVECLAHPAWPLGIHSPLLSNLEMPNCFATAHSMHPFTAKLICHSPTAQRACAMSVPTMTKFFNPFSLSLP